MFKSQSKRFVLGFLAFALTFASGSTYPDDTDIYFNQSANSIRPNVLFILDTSTSMTIRLNNTSEARIDSLKRTLNTILNDAEDINLGLMRFDIGGSVLFPIAPIDDPAFNTVSEPNALQPTFTYTLGEDDNDGVQENAGNTVSLFEPILIMGNTPAGGPGSIDVRITARSDSVTERNNRVSSNTELRLRPNDGSIVGIRFNGITIPQGAVINTATLELTTESDEGGSSANFNILADDVDHSTIFADDLPDLSTRIRLIRDRVIATWSGHNDSPDEGTDAYASSAFVSVIQNIIDRPGWTPGNSLSLFLGNSNQRRHWHSFQRRGRDDPTLLPRLRITYTSPPAPAAATQVALHFPVLDIPQGLTVTDARLIFTSATNENGPASWNIDAENIDDSPALTNTDNNIGGRTLTGTPVTAVSPDPVNANDTFTSPDISSVIQTVVNRPGWCGGNAITFVITGSGNRYLHSYDSNSSLAPRLQVTFDRTTSTTGSGCAVNLETAQISTGADDMSVRSGRRPNNRNSVFFTRPGFSVGLRFQDIDIPRNAEILEANISLLSFRSPELQTGATNFLINGELSPDANTFGNINLRPLTSAAVTWIPTDWVGGQTYTSTDLRTVVQEIVNQGAWNSGNSMAFRIATTGGGERNIASYNSNPATAPRLSVTYRSSNTVAATAKSVRRRMVELIGETRLLSITPITETLYEAAHYWRGESVVNGRRKDFVGARISHPGSYCFAPNDCNGANTARFPPYGVEEPAGCSTINLDTFECRDVAIRGTPRYISPFSSELSCARNYQVLLTDGEANSNRIANTIRSEYLGGTACRTNKSDGSPVTRGEACAIDLVGSLAQEDQNSILDNDQTVITYTIGFDTANLPNATQFLRDVATEGGGEFFEATSTSALLAAFNAILSDVKSDTTSIVSPSLATNAFNRLFSRDEVFFGLFTPELTAAWEGNVKKYTVCTEVGILPNCDFVTRILDANGDTAVDTDDRFKTTSQSLWSDLVDGIETVKGGTGGESTDFNDRLIYTETTATGTAPASGTALSTSGFNIKSTNWDADSLATVRSAVCPTPSTTTGSDCEDRMLFMLGKVIVPQNSDLNVTTRWTVNDVLHSSPVTITYNGVDTSVPPDGIIDNFYDKLIYGTNDGGLRMINATNGKEDWMFVPQSAIDLQQIIWTNAEDEHAYGIDSTPVVVINDVANDGIVKPADGDTVHAYFGMRRGGNFLYALDLTATVTSSASRVVPKFLWRIEGGVVNSPFQYLADTWSLPNYSTILTSTGAQDVLIFGGGYDTALDDGFGIDATGGSENNGNMIFVVNPADGSLIFSIGGSNTNATLKIPEMKYSIAAQPAVLDTTGDGNENRIYIADTGGQMWRVDLASDISIAGSAGSTVVGRLADIATESGVSPTPATLANERRFFEKPEIAAISDTVFTEAGNSLYFLVTIGSGNRVDPLSTSTHDRFYAFRDFEIGTMTGSSGANPHIAQGYPRTSSVPLDESVMVDITLATLDEDSVAVDEAFGWYLDFTTDGHIGEKVFATPLITSGNVFFTTYEPIGDSTSVCSANIGGGRLLGINVTTTAGFVTDDVAGRTISDTLSGVASGVIPFYSPEGIYGLVGVEGGVWQSPPDPDPECTGPLCDGGLRLGENSGVLTYWSEE